MNTEFNKPFTFDRVVRIVIALVCIILVLLFINSIKSVLLPFLVAWLIAYMINPLVEWNQRIMHLKSRIPAIFITFAEIAIAFTLIGLIVIPMIVNETRHLYELVSLYVQSSHSIPFIPETVQDFVRQNITTERIGALLSTRMDETRTRCLRTSGQDIHDIYTRIGHHSELGYRTIIHILHTTRLRCRYQPLRSTHPPPLPPYCHQDRT